MLELDLCLVEPPDVGGQAGGCGQPAVGFTADLGGDAVLVLNVTLDLAEEINPFYIDIDRKKLIVVKSVYDIRRGLIAEESVLPLAVHIQDFRR